MNNGSSISVRQATDGCRPRLKRSREWDAVKSTPRLVAISTGPRLIRFPAPTRMKLGDSTVHSGAALFATAWYLRVT
jgi:hypothetical protein